MVRGLFSRHAPALQVTFSELKRQALELPEQLLGTPGSVGVREVNGSTFYYRQYYDAEGNKTADYLGATNDPSVQARVASVREHIQIANQLKQDIRLLASLGYARVDRKVNAVLVALANERLFVAGAVLLGSHAYGALLNELGVRAAAFTTEDVDIGRGEPLKLAGERDFQDILASSGVRLQPVPGLDKRSTVTSYKAPGRDRFRVDLLAHTSGSVVRPKALAELKAHALALPHLDAVLAAPLESVVLGQETPVAVRVPRPEALAWHKAFLSQLGARTLDKRRKDLLQAAVLLAVLAEDAPEALSAELERLPAGARAKALAGASQLLPELGARRHERAVELLGELGAA